MFVIDIALADGATLSLFWPPILLLGIFIGFLTGLFGVGGGFLLTPVLNILFGVPFPIAVGSGLAMIFVTGSNAAYKHGKRGNVDYKLGAIMAVAACLGTLVGKQVMVFLERYSGTIMIGGQESSVLDLVMKALFLVLMAVVMISILRETSRSKADPDQSETSGSLAKRLQAIRLAPMLSFEKSGIEQMTLWAPLLISLFVGVVTGLMGVGGGFILFPLLVYIIGLGTTRAVGTSSFLILFSTGIGTIAYSLSGQVWWALVGVLLGGSFIGVQIGVKASSIFKGQAIRRYFSYVIGLGILVILIDLLRQFVFSKA